MYLIVGLGNPGDRYEATRHNVGFMVVTELAARLGEASFRRHCRSQVMETRRGVRRLVLARPETYMNRSGEAVASLLAWYKPEPESLLLVYDDMDLPLGRLRLRRCGTAGSHNGMRSVINALGRSDIPRLRLGIGSAEKDAVGHVLGSFREAERPELQKMILLAADAVQTVVDCGIELAMNRYNVGNYAGAEDSGEDGEQ